METLIQAGARRMAVASVPVGTNPQSRESRLFRSLAEYVRRSGATIVRSYATYQPLKVFFGIGGAIALLGLLGVARFLYFFATESGGGHVQSLVLSGALRVVGFQVALIGLLADLIAANRRLSEETLYRLRRLECDLAESRRRHPGEPDSSAPFSPGGDGPAREGGEVTASRASLAAGAETEASLSPPNWRAGQQHGG
jgi:hypothetical protein